MNCPSSLPVIEQQRMAASTCPNCGRSGMTPFYSCENVPAHSCLLMSSREEAIAYPRGSILLAFCRSCGFIANLRFDPTLNDYSPEYEETQHFSARFNRFARGLVDRLVNQYDIRRKTIIEIGCGKADLLAMICQAGDNRGIGIDPTCRPERLSSDDAARVTLIRDIYSEKHTQLSADVLLCRHTLEHIQPTRDFVRMVRDSIRDRPETLVFFELPDVTRVLREAAFWDIYYEHCSYFSTCSLGNLFRELGFEILELVREFDDQYLCLTARPDSTHSTCGAKQDFELDALLHDIEQFQQTQATKVQMWQRKLAKAFAGGRRAVVWGAGSKAVAFFNALGISDEVESVVDINPHKHGKYLPGTGHEIVAPNVLAQHRPEVVVVMNPIYCDEIAADLDRLGVDAEVIAV